MSAPSRNRDDFMAVETGCPLWSRDHLAIGFRMGVWPMSTVSRFKNMIFKPGREMDDLRRELGSLLKPGMGSQLLDVGCGEGDATQTYARVLDLPMARVEGIEPQEKYKYTPPFKVHSLDIEREKFPFPDEKFDIVICNQVLEHLKIVIHPLREMVRVVRAGGYLVLGIPNLASLMSRVYLAFGRQPICLAFPGPHIRGFSDRAFRKFLFANRNLELLKVSGSALYPFPPPLCQTVARMYPGMACYTLYLLQKVRHDTAADWPVDQYLDESITG